MRKEKKNKICESAFNRFMAIDTSKDLEREGLTLSDYNSVFNILAELNSLNGESVKTFNTKVAEWFKRNGFTVQMDVNKVNYLISL